MDHGDPENRVWTTLCQRPPFYSLVPPGVSVTRAPAVGSMVSMEFKGQIHLIKSTAGP